MERDISQEILNIKNKKGAIILAHFYQTLDIQELADFVGDSLKLSMDAMKAEASMIIFCGVLFMAEQAAVLNPEIPVYIPDQDAVCSLANMLSIDDIVRAKRKYPNAPIVMYVNSKAIHKAYADYIVTSANAVSVIQEIPQETIIFGPDRNLAEHVAYKTGKKIIPVPEDGHCYVHVVFSKNDVEKFKEKGYAVIVHPECPCDVRMHSNFIGSTKQMYNFIKKSKTDKIAVGTEIGFVERAKKDFPDKEIVPLRPDAICEDMKKITLQKLYNSLKKEVYRVVIDKPIAKKIKVALDRTFKLLGLI